MTPEEAFWQDISTDPEDTTTPLIYADWLEERGDEESAAKAMFLRCCCRLKALAPHDKRRKKLIGRLTQLMKRYENDWLKPLKAHNIHFSYFQGFPLIWFPWVERFLAHADEVFTPGFLSPYLRVDLEDNDGLRPADFDAVLSSPHLRHVWRLGFLGYVSYSTTPSINREQLRRLVATPGLRTLVHLNLDSNALTEDDAGLLAESPNLVGLETLDLCYNNLEREGIGKLLASPGLRGLKQLIVCGNRVTPRDQAELEGRFGERVSFSDPEDEPT